MSEALFTSTGLFPIVQVPVVPPKKKPVPVCGVAIVSRQPFASVDGKDEEEVIVWEDGATLQIHRRGMGRPGV